MNGLSYCIKRADGQMYVFCLSLLEKEVIQSENK